MDVFHKIDIILGHIDHVRQNTEKLGKRLMEEGQVHFGIRLIQNGLKHDNSKFEGIEFEHLFRGDELLMDAVKHHSSTNEHHPEYWGGIDKMPDLYLAEMVCDIAARSAELGTGVRDWIFTKGAEKFHFTKDDPVGQKITYYLDRLLDSFD